MWSTRLLGSVAFAGTVFGGVIQTRADDARSSCPGYAASNVVTTATGLTADLTLAGTACNAYGNDIQNLTLMVNYDAESRLHVKIQDAGKVAYTVPLSVFPTPDNSSSVSAANAALEFQHTDSPFSFKVVRKSNQEVLFDTSAAPIIFEDQYLRLRTSLPANPNIYGLGEHTDNMRLNTTDYTRTLWSRDSYGVPKGQNLYGNHPIYFDHRGDKGTHGVFMLSSAGMDIKINSTGGDAGQYLEYNMLSGIIDLYFFDGPSPIEVAQEYSAVAGKAAMMPYWGFGFHQCRYGYRDFYSIAEVVYNYSMSGIPLETMWTDIDYMYQRYIMTTDPDRFPLDRVREYIDYIHAHDQKYIVMVDPAMAYQTERENNLPYEAFVRARDQGILLQKNGSIFKGVVWPGETAFPDWFHPGTADYWNNEFVEFFSAENGVDIDGLWIDMNEAANFNVFGEDTAETTAERGFPPRRLALRSAPRAIPGFPDAFQPNASSPYPPDSIGYAPPYLAPAAAPNSPTIRVRAEYTRNMHGNLITRQSASNTTLIGFQDRDYLEPAYQIKNANTQQAFGGLSNFTLDTDIIHYDGHVEIDVHNLYGAQMSTFSRNAMLARRPSVRPLVITRSTFAGSGRGVGKWLGDNLSEWEHYRFSIYGMLNFVSFFQVPMTGSDVCGFGGNTTEQLCARWASLGAFHPFYRNHNGDTSIPQEFFNWPLTMESAKKAIDIRYRLLDYIYTALHVQSTTGTPLAQPLFFHYPNDTKTFDVQLQFFYGPAILVSPVTEENSTSVVIYLPNDLFYDFYTYAKVQGSGNTLTLNNISYTDIPLHVKAGSAIAMRAQSGNTTTAVRKQPFNILVAPSVAGTASGQLYLDDGESIEQPATSSIDLTYTNSELKVSGSFGYTAENNALNQVIIMGVGSAPSGVTVGGQKGNFTFDEGKKAVTVTVNQPLTGEISVKFEGLKYSAGGNATSGATSVVVEKGSLGVLSVLVLGALALLL